MAQGDPVSRVGNPGPPANITATGDLATEAEQAEQTAALETLAGTVTAFVPLAGDPGVNVKISASSTLSVQVVTEQTASATPDAAATGIVARLAGITSEAVGEGGLALDTGAYQRGDWTVTLGPGDPGKPQFVQGVNELGEPERLATEASVDDLEVDADATRVASESVDAKTPTLGLHTMAESTSIVFATDHPPVGSELYVGGSQLSNSNPIPIQGTVPPRTPTGTPTAAASGQIGTDGSGALLYLRMHIPSPSGTRFILIFDAAAATPPATANMIPAVTFPFTPTLGRAEQRFGYPVGFVNGLQWAVSSTEHTYTAAVDTAYVFAQWVMA
jgi:hypothetical protein